MTTPSNDVDGLGVVVIGGTHGAIGRAITAGLAGRGARVVGTSRTSDGAADWPTVALDVTSAVSVTEGFEAAVAHLGRIDAVINTAGVTSQSDFIATPLDAWDRIIATNLTGAFVVAQAATRVMLENVPVDGARGSIVTIASLCAVAGCDYVAAYSASKAVDLVVCAGARERDATRSSTENIGMD